MAAGAEKAAGALKLIDLQLGEVGVKAGRTRSITEQLTNRYVEGAKEAATMSRALQNLSVELERGKVSETQASAIYRGLVREIGAAANETNLFAAAHNKLGTIVAATNRELAEEVRLTNEATRARTALQQTEARLAQHQSLGRSSPANDNTAHRQFAAQNVAFQLQDVVTTAAGGMNPLMIGLQQGSQISGAFGGMGAKAAGATLLSAIGGLLSPVSLLAVGLTAAGAAAIKFGVDAISGTAEADKAVTNHARLVRDVQAAYKDASGGLAEYQQRSAAEVEASARLNFQAAQKAYKKEVTGFVDSIVPSGGLFGRLGFDRQFEPFRKEITDLKDAAKTSTPDLAAFRAAVEARAQIDPSFGAIRDKLLAAGESAFDAERALKSAQEIIDITGGTAQNQVSGIKALTDALRELASVGQPVATDMERIAAAGNTAMRGMARLSPQEFEEGRRRLLIGQSLAQQRLDAQSVVNSSGVRVTPPTPTARPNIELDWTNDDQTRLDLENSRRRMQAELQSLRARSVDEKAAAAGAREAATVIHGEDDATRQGRISLAQTLARAQAEHQLEEAQRARLTAIRQGLEQERLGVQLIGQTIDKTTELQTQYRLMSALREEAARNGITSESEFQRLYAREIELTRQASAEFGKLARTRAVGQLRDNLTFERDQLFRTSTEQQIAQTQRGAGLPVDMSSPEADMIRKNMQIAEWRSSISTFATDFRQELVSSGGKVGQALGKTLLNAAVNALTKDLDKQLENIFTKLLSALLKGGDNAAGAGNAAAGIAGKVLSSANTGLGSDGLTPGARSAFSAAASGSASAGAGAAASGDIASYITKAAMQRGIDPDIALRVARSEGGLDSWNRQSLVMKNGVQEPSFGPYQLYMGGGLGNAFQRQTGLDPRLAANGPAGVDFALDHAAKNGWGAWYGAKHAGIGNWQGIGAAPGVGAEQTGSVMNSVLQQGSAAAKGLGDVAKATTGTVQGVGQLGTALSSLGQQMSLSPMSGSAVGQYGGLWGGIGKMIGGISPTSSLWAPNTTLQSFLMTGHADGTESSPGGLVMVGERGREIVNMPRGAQVTPNHRTESLMAAAANSNRGSGGGDGGTSITVQVMGNAYGNAHLEKVVSEGVRSGLASKAQSDRRGGAGALYQSYQKQKA
ncbi:hypothetical protein BTR14_20530 [Rhizobium rhizosphaerae]|uniref:Bacteriophage tail tape measure N-terminal domain-containing protein n=2 Tax=Xaviernesmea rhizosphaerae TaxID=1672749 RepID=A0ABX3P7Y7_9HYPH|nr:hypothetical protein BTR14_20530 [Xaviernesmea rhizosphaerae]